MPNNSEKIIKIFENVLSAVLVEQNAESIMPIIAEDIIGIGMGTQGLVYTKDDVLRILSDNKNKIQDNKVTFQYENLQIRCYDDCYATICAAVKLTTITADKNVTVTTIGQLMNLRSENGKWVIYTLQATPLFNKIEEMEAYPIKFAENVLEKYRQQEQMSKKVQHDSVGIYHIDFTKNIFMDSVIADDLLICPPNGAAYENVIIHAAQTRLGDKYMQKFIDLFSLENVFKTYSSGNMELSIEYEMLLSNNETIWLESILKLYTDRVDRNLKGYLYVVDINDKKKFTIELENKAELDPLTGLYNKRNTELKIAKALNLVSMSNKGAFLMIDLDCFKNINDTFGHKEGDRILKETAQCIHLLIGEKDIGGRIGGDEFCIYFQGISSDEIILEKANLLCKMITKINLRGIKVTCSIGIAFANSCDISFDEIYLKADSALYMQKNNGRDGYTVYP